MATSNASLHNTDKPVVIAVVGPTATGKTPAGVALAKALSSEVISADSRLVYRGMDIGTAKPTPEERQGVPHHLIDVANPDETFTVAQYQALAEPIIQRLHQQHKIPILVGGTGFYLRALLSAPNHIAHVPPNPEFRSSLKHTYATSEALHQYLQQLDPVRASQLYPQDEARILRALEIIDATGCPVPQVDIHATEDSPYRVIWLGLTYDDREHHRNLIRKRVDAMLHDGWMAEVETLMQQWGPTAHALTITHGYPELVQAIQQQHAGDMPDMETLAADIAQQVSQYARRQRTWHKKNPAIHWISIDTYPSAQEAIHSAVEQTLSNMAQP